MYSVQQAFCSERVIAGSYEDAHWYSNLIRRNQLGEAKEYVCPVEDCCRKFTSRSGFTNHQKKHNEETAKKETELEMYPELKEELPQLSLVLVLFSLSQRSAASKEESSPAPLFACQIPGCFKTFTNQNSLNFHTYRVHLGIDSSLCNKTRW